MIKYDKNSVNNEYSLYIDWINRPCCCQTNADSNCDCTDLLVQRTEWQINLCLIVVNVNSRTFSQNSLNNNFVVLLRNSKVGLSKKPLRFQGLKSTSNFFKTLNLIHTLPDIILFFLNIFGLLESHVTFNLTLFHWRSLLYFAFLP